MAPATATPEGTAKYAARFPAASEAGFFRAARGWTVSSLGIGTYMGGMDDASDAAYVDAITAALDGGINLVDTSLNYRHQRSERNIGEALGRAAVTREEIVLCTKAGYLVPGAVPDGAAGLEVVGRMHSMHPDFLADQLTRSLVNLHTGAVDVFYLHNPETQLDFVSEAELYARLERAFGALEGEAARGRIGYYGAATWSGFREKGKLSLDRFVKTAESVGGASHRFRFIQVPFNLAMTEGLSMGVFEEAARRGIHVVTSASILQSKLAQGLPEELAKRLPGPSTDAQRAIQFARSAPGVVASLVGMGRAAHVVENLGVSGFPPADPQTFRSLFA